MHTQHHRQAPVPTPTQKGTPPATQAAAAVAGVQSHKAPSVSTEAIQLCAYRKWEQAGKPPDSSMRFWLEAEQELARKK